MTDRSSNPENEGQPIYELITRIADKDEAAAGDLYDLTSRRVYGLVLKILRKPELAEEATLDVYLKIWNQADRFDPAMGSPQVWLNTLTRNAALDLLRKESRRTRLESPDELLAEFEQSGPSQEELTYQTQRGQQIADAMKSLSKGQREAILAAYFAGMSHGEIALAFNQPLGSIKTRIRTGLQILRRGLDGQKEALS